ncbi:uncharacterized protein LOC110263543 [Arachis ipaensis]|uniref:uncharacterized protein LOC110263543 n=1 Tax=Arachis ipaensis TaxID=130454 RepID=UPI000A2B7131|nr:uncharacterized protein LOC110263543 [Arachis ipaensis]
MLLLVLKSLLSLELHDWRKPSLMELLLTWPSCLYRQETPSRSRQSQPRRCCRSCRFGASKREEFPEREKCQGGGTIRCCVVPVAVRMYLSQAIVLAAGVVGVSRAELLLSLSRFSELSPAPSCRYSGPNSAQFRTL